MYRKSYGVKGSKGGGNLLWRKSEEVTKKENYNSKWVRVENQEGKRDRKGTTRVRQSTGVLGSWSVTDYGGWSWKGDFMSENVGLRVNWWITPTDSLRSLKDKGFTLETSKVVGQGGCRQVRVDYRYDRRSTSVGTEKRRSVGCTLDGPSGQTNWKFYVRVSD